jgi:nitrogen-specific signal transduction histidine kinase
MLSAGSHLPQRARFEALRQRIFGEMSRATARQRLVTLAPFQLFVFSVLVLRGAPMARIIVYACAAATSTAMFLVMAKRQPRGMMSAQTLALGIVCVLMSTAVTGGLASPLLITGIPLAVAVAVTVTGPDWIKRGLTAFMLIGYVGIAVLSHTSIGALPYPLAPRNGWPSPEYVALAASSVFYVIGSVHGMGCRIARGYERIALELAERREELCSENEDRTRALEGIAARLAHEVKNPLAAIKGLSVHMARSASDPKMAERLSIVAAEADRLQSIVDGFLSFSRGFDDLKIAPTHPMQLVRELMVLLETRASDSGLLLEVSGDESVVVDADARKLRQAVLNLVLNAMQASPEGRTVKVDVASTGCGGARIRIIDEGSGMTPEVLSRITKPYFTTKEAGSGLGVAVARGLVEQHGGKLEFESTPGKGTTVTIELPARARMVACSLPGIKASRGSSEGERAPIGKPAGASVR